MREERTRNKKKRAAVKKAVGPGLHAGLIEVRSGASFRVRLLTGEHVRAKLAPGITTAFVEACHRASRTVLIADGERGPLLIGALEVPRAEGEPIELRAKEIRLRADQTITLEVGRSALRLDHTGAAHLEGKKLVVDVASLVRFLSARVELP